MCCLRQCRFRSVSVLMAVDPVFVYIFCRRFVADGGLALGIFALLNSSENGNNERGSDAYRTGHSSFFFLLLLSLLLLDALRKILYPSSFRSSGYIIRIQLAHKIFRPCPHCRPLTCCWGRKKREAPFVISFFTIIPSMRLFSMSFFRFRFIYLSVAFFFLAMTLDAGAASLDGWFS